MNAAHDSRISGHFAFSETLLRLQSYHWKHRTTDIEAYCCGCLTCQQRKDSNKKKFTNPSSVEVPFRRWGSIATDFIVSLPKTKDGFDSITTRVDRLSRCVHFIPSCTTDSEVETAESFFVNIFRHYGLPDDIVSDRDPKVTSKF